MVIYLLCVMFKRVYLLQTPVIVLIYPSLLIQLEKPVVELPTKETSWHWRLSKQRGVQGGWGSWGREPEGIIKKKTWERRWSGSTPCWTPLLKESHNSNNSNVLSLIFTALQPVSSISTLDQVECIQWVLDFLFTLKTGWWFPIFLFLPLPGEMIEVNSYFQMGWNLKPPTK